MKKYKTVLGGVTKNLFEEEGWWDSFVDTLVDPKGESKNLPDGHDVSYGKLKSESPQYTNTKPETPPVQPASPQPAAKPAPAPAPAPTTTASPSGTPAAPASNGSQESPGFFDSVKKNWENMTPMDKGVAIGAPAIALTGAAYYLLKKRRERAKAAAENDPYNYNYNY